MPDKTEWQCFMCGCVDRLGEASVPRMNCECACHIPWDFVNCGIPLSSTESCNPRKRTGAGKATEPSSATTRTFGKISPTVNQIILPHEGDIEVSFNFRLQHGDLCRIVPAIPQTIPMLNNSNRQWNYKLVPDGNLGPDARES